MLLNAGTGEVIPFSNDTTPTKGKWVLRRPLTLPESTLPLFLEVPLIPDGVAVGKSARASNGMGFGSCHKPAFDPPPISSFSHLWRRR